MFVSLHPPKRTKMDLHALVRAHNIGCQRWRLHGICLDSRYWMVSAKGEARFQLLAPATHRKKSWTCPFCVNLGPLKPSARGNEVRWVSATVGELPEHMLSRMCQLWMVLWTRSHLWVHVLAVVDIGLRDAVERGVMDSTDFLACEVWLEHGIIVHRRGDTLPGYRSVIPMTSCFRRAMFAWWWATCGLLLARDPQVCCWIQDDSAAERQLVRACVALVVSSSGLV